MRHLVPIDRSAVFESTSNEKFQLKEKEQCLSYVDDDDVLLKWEITVNQRVQKMI
jgi:hypothetical protein